MLVTREEAERKKRRVLVRILVFIACFAVSSFILPKLVGII